MSKSGNNNWEKDVSKAVTDIMDSIDLAGIKKNVKDTMTDLEYVIKQQTKEFGDTFQANKKQKPPHVGPTYGRPKSTDYKRNGRPYNYQQREAYGRPYPRPLQPAVQQRPVARRRPQGLIPVGRKIPGRVAGVLNIIFGSIGLATFFPIMTWMFFEGLLYGDMALLTVSMALFLPLTLASGIMLPVGIAQRVRISRFNRYLHVIGNRTFVSIEELSLGMQKRPKQVLNEVRTMIRLGMFAEGHIDRSNKNLILTHETYQAYLEAEDKARREAIEQKMSQIEKKEQEEKPKPEAVQVVERGREYIREMKAVNAQLGGSEMSQKLDRLEQVTSKIFMYVESNPHKLPEIRKFMDYYLPTTLKLMNAYKEFEGQQFEGNVLTNAKEEISQTFDTINEAFENLFDSMFEDAAMDISTDISVLETMLAQEGLTKRDFQE